ncbi:inositol monophosphatase 3-like [Anguilla anguilla]|uniref:inositol monophosphatase 3-like n=1 Tax=Anguilla anguilla TaxID=7936 RepID=UPI0015B344D4|nr:inositol monophosphatase 3-like [Anguilla anguilla]
MAPMGIRLSPVGVAVFCLLGVGIIYHLYAGVISSRIAALRRRRTVDLRELLALSVEAAVLGGREVKRAREENPLEKSNGKTKGGASEKIALGDQSSHRKMYHLIKNTFPFLQVNAEERAPAGGEEAGVWNHVIPADLQLVGEGREVSADDITVWIDPLDAAQEYTKNLQKHVTTMVCVAVSGVPVIGVIHKPFTEYTAWALVGSGSNLQPRAPHGGRSLQVIVSRSHAGKATRFIQTAFGNETVVHTAGGAGYKVLALLDPPDEQYEQADVYLHITYIKKRDVCAGNAILKALGGHMTTLKGEEIDYRAAEANHGGVLASVGRDHRALLAKLQSADSHRQS